MKNRYTLDCRVFRRMDDDSNTSLNYDEFNKGLRETGLQLSEEQTNQLFSRFDNDDSGTIDITEFLIAVRVSSDFWHTVLCCNNKLLFLIT